MELGKFDACLTSHHHKGDRQHLAETLRIYASRVCVHPNTDYLRSIGLLDKEISNYLTLLATINAEDAENYRRTRVDNPYDIF